MTLREILIRTAERLRPVSGDDANAEARELVSFALGRRIGFSDKELTLGGDRAEKLESCIERRLAHEPLQYIIGEWDLMGLTFSVTPDVLIPRQDTETLCEIAEKLIRERGYKRLLDLCTGSGCIGLAVGKRTGAAVTLADISAEALAVAKTNAAALGVPARLVQSDLFSAFGGEEFDIITVNPPYIPSAVIETLSPEVQREPRLALDGGADGLALYRRIREDFASHLAPGGTLLMEIGFDQGESVPALFAGTGEITLIRDDGGRDRVVTAELPDARAAENGRRSENETFGETEC
ncbi:MAG: peptide chain release factor N(5)-glutamine methyltransferase [Clostridia bacterium]|nr:peptide chain release factor N(5)-glutamine methyltransferase [Clostridia bacterium]